MIHVIEKFRNPYIGNSGLKKRGGRAFLRGGGHSGKKLSHYFLFNWNNLILSEKIMGRTLGVRGLLYDGEPFPPLTFCSQLLCSKKIGNFCLFLCL